MSQLYTIEVRRSHTPLRRNRFYWRMIEMVSGHQICRSSEGYANKEEAAEFPKQIAAAMNTQGFTVRLVDMT